jgi:hypothetical protein
MSYDNLSSVSQNVLKFYQLLTGEERRIPFIFYGFHFCHSRVITLDMMESRVFYPICRTTTWVSVSQNLLNFISDLIVKRGGSLRKLQGCQQPWFRRSFSDFQTLNPTSDIINVYSTDHKLFMYLTSSIIIKRHKHQIFWDQLARRAANNLLTKYKLKSLWTSHMNLYWLLQQ